MDWAGALIMGNRQLIYPAPAKLNLFLHVVGRRADGYHLLQTIFQLIDYADELHFTVRADGVIRHLSPIPGVDPEQDLCIKAARLLQSATHCKLGVDISLNKRIPMGGGLGGGSSDAATVLIALNRLWGLGLNRAELQALGLQLGADVPVFVFGQNAFAEGIGEALQAVRLPETWYVVLTPPVLVPTIEIFKSPQLTRNTNPIKISDFSIEQTHNDLQAVVCQKFLIVADYLAWLNQFGHARMTGSGACVFARFPEERQAKAVFDQLPCGMSGFVAKGLSEHPLYQMIEN